VKLSPKAQKDKRKHIMLFWTLILTFGIILSGAFIGEWLHGQFFIPSIAIFFLLGLALTYFTIKEKVKGLLKKLLILTGSSGAGFFIFVILHNLFYALGIITSHIIILKYLMEFLHVVFFLVAVIVCPLGFLVGTIGSIVQFFKGYNRNI